MISPLTHGYQIASTKKGETLFLTVRARVESNMTLKQRQHPMEHYPVRYKHTQQHNDHIINDNKENTHNVDLHGVSFFSQILAHSDEISR